MAVFLKIEVVNLVFLMTFFVTSSSLTVCSRLILRQMLIRLRLRGRNLRHALIVGTNPRAIEFARKIESKAELGYRIVGFVDDHWAGIREFQKTGYAHVINFEEFPVFLREYVVDEVVIGLPMNSYYQQASRIVALCEEQGIIVRFFSSLFNPKLARCRTEQEDDSVITLFAGATEGWPILAKRALDFVLLWLYSSFSSPCFC